MKRRVLSVAVALCLTVGLCIPVWATSDITSTTTAAPGDGGEVGVTLNGRLSYNPEQIKVTLPTSVIFYVDPTKKVTSDNPTAQVTSGGTFTVCNYSNVDIYLYIFNRVLGNVEFTDKASQITDTSDYIYFTVYSEGDPLPDLSADTLDSSYYIEPNYDTYAEIHTRYLVTKNPIAAGSSSSPESRVCYIATRVGLGFAPGDVMIMSLYFIVDTSSNESY